MAHATDFARLLRIRGLTVRYNSVPETRPALLDVNAEIGWGEIVGILGESGSGKSTLALSILHLLPQSAAVSGSVLFKDQDLASFSESAWNKIRGARIAMIFQEPALSLCPVMRVGDQIAEILRAHNLADGNRKQQITALLRNMVFSTPERIYRAYPHQLSGGELHRVAIAQALACSPDLLIADEPTRSLDVSRQAEILRLLQQANRKSGCAIVFITHNPALLAGFAHRVMVMYAGRVVEDGPVSQVFRNPLHPYTKGLLQLLPKSDLTISTAVRQLPTIPGSLRDSDRDSAGCVFAPRCAARSAICDSKFPGEIHPDSRHSVSCFNYGN
jgi:peptide/nickel transport system ATP-binding protein